MPLRHDWTVAEAEALLGSTVPRPAGRCPRRAPRAASTRRWSRRPSCCRSRRAPARRTAPTARSRPSTTPACEPERLMGTDEIVAAARNAQASGRDPVLHGRGLAIAQRPPGGAGGRGRRGRGRARAGDLRRRSGCSRPSSRSASPTPVSTSTTTTSTPRRSSTARSSPPAPTTIGSTRSPTCATPGVKVCCGGIVGHGRVAPRAGRAARAAGRASTRTPRACRSTCWCRCRAPRCYGTPELDPLELVRTIAAARIMMPASVVRLSAGRTEMTDELQALCLHAGASSIFLGDRLLTTPNPGDDHDQRPARAARRVAGVRRRSGRLSLRERRPPAPPE